MIPDSVADGNLVNKGQSTLILDGGLGVRDPRLFQRGTALASGFGDT